MRAESLTIFQSTRKRYLETAYMYEQLFAYTYKNYKYPFNKPNYKKCSLYYMVDSSNNMN